jgi:hypothetical protein
VIDVFYFKVDLWDGVTGGMGMIDMAQEMDKWLALMNMVTKLQVR